MKRKSQATALKIDIDDNGKTKIIVQQGRFADMRLWGDLLANAAKAIAEAHEPAEDAQKSLALIQMGFLAEISNPSG